MAALRGYDSGDAVAVLREAGRSHSFPFHNLSFCESHVAADIVRENVNDARGTENDLQQRKECNCQLIPDQADVASHC
jgi:hypothetical protein